MKICIIVPVHDEERTIGALVDSIKQTAQGDVLVVDDGSSDRSAQTAINAGAYLIHHPRRMGKGASLKEGFRHAISQGYEGVITLDGDGQHAPEEVSRFIDEAEKSGADIIIGNRMNDTKKMPWLRYVTNKLMSWLISLACGQRIVDTQCGYRYISTQALKTLDLRTDGFEIETEILIKAAKKELTIRSIPITTIYQDEKSKIHPIRDAARFLKYFCKELWSSKN